MSCFTTGVTVVTAHTQGQDWGMTCNSFTQGERFEGQSLVRGVNKHPRLDGVIAWFDCRIAQVVSAGDHDILIGEVLDFGVQAGHGLAYAQRSFGVLAAFDE